MKNGGYTGDSGLAPTARPEVIAAHMRSCAVLALVKETMLGHMRNALEDFDAKLVAQQVTGDDHQKYHHDVEVEEETPIVVVELQNAHELTESHVRECILIHEERTIYS